VNQVSSDGRVVLRKDVLKSLRRELGASQEKVAFLCADRGLCVSVASLKRAETSKNVLYRTAKDLAKFYQIDVTKLVDQPSQNDSESSAKAEGVTPLMRVQRSFIILGCHLESFSSPSLTTSEVVSSLAHIATQHGAVLHTEGDEYIFYTFGLDVSPGNEVRRAIYFGNRFMQVISTLYGDEFRCRVGISWAEVEVDNKHDKNEINIHQKYVDDVKQILQLTENQNISVTTDVKNSIPDEFYCTGLAHGESGKKFWQVSYGYSKTESKKVSPFVGRKVELTQFKAILQSTAEYSSTHIVHLIGPAGIGKSRLSEEFCSTAALDDFEIHNMSILDFCVEQHQQAIPQLLRSLLNIKEHEQSLSLEELVGRNQLVWLNETQYLPLLYSLLHWPLTKEWASLLDAMSTERLYSARCQLIANIIKTKARNKSLLIRCEDYHWADKQLRQYLHQITGELENVAVVFLITSRPGNAITHLANANESSNVDVTQIALSPLSKKDALSLAGAFKRSDQDYQQQCIEKAQGNPLFLEQLLLDQSALSEKGLPFSLQALIVSRIDGMTEADQLAVRSAAVIGQNFSLSLLRELVQNPSYDPSALIHANIIGGMENEFSFKHALIMEGIYFSITAKDREKLHYQCSQWYQEDIVLQCHHLIKAKHADANAKIVPAVAYLIQHYNYDEAKNLIELGSSLENNENIKTPLYELLAEVNSRLGETSEALLAYQHMFDSAGDEENKIKALIGASNCFNTLDNASEAQKNLELAHEIATDYGDASLLSKIYYLKGNFAFPSGKVDECFTFQKQAYEYALQADDSEMQARSLGGLGDAAYAQGKMYSAHDYFRRCLDICDKYDLKTVAAANYFMLGTVSIYHNETQKALAVTEKSILTADLVGHKRAEIVSRLTASWILLDWLRLDEAKEHIDIGLALAKEIGAKRFVPFLLEAKARYFLLVKNSEEGQATINSALEKIDELKAHTFIGPWLLSTQAYFASDWAEAKNILLQGEKLLEKGCIGHNYYRFYVAAIEVSLSHKKIDKTNDYIDKFKTYIGSEQVPWANFYLARAEFLNQVQEGSDKTDSSLGRSLIETAQEAKLLSSIPLIDEALSDIVAL
jgi:tetratricopeptide (TPR) repeat protein